MNVVLIGAGYVGLVSGACFAEFGANVSCIDVDEDKIAALQKGVVPIYEPGLEALVVRNVSEGRLCFSSELGKAVEDADLVFIAVGTPSRRGAGCRYGRVTALAALVGEDRGRSGENRR